MNGQDDQSIVRPTTPEDEHAEVQMVTAASAASFSGPLPPPSYIREYEEVLPGSADRILQMAERESVHRQSLERQSLEIQSAAVNEDLSRSRLGLFLGAFVALAFIGAAVALASMGYAWQGTSLGLVNIVAIVTAFIYGAQRRGRDVEAEDE